MIDIKIDVRRLLDDLERALLAIVSNVDDVRVTHYGETRSGLGFKISEKISIKIGLLEGLDIGETRGVLSERKEPLIDVFEDKNRVKIVTLLPGVKREDVQLDIKDQSLIIKIKKVGETYSKIIPCDIRASKAVVKSVSDKNSVIEIVIEKEKR